MLTEIMDWTFQGANILWIAIPFAVLLLPVTYATFDDGIEERGSFMHFVLSVMWAAAVGFVLALMWPAIIAMAILLMVLYVLWLLLRTVGIIRPSS